MTKPPSSSKGSTGPEGKKKLSIREDSIKEIDVNEPAEEEHEHYREEDEDLPAASIDLQPDPVPR